MSFYDVNNFQALFVFISRSFLRLIALEKLLQILLYLENRSRCDGAASAEGKFIANFFTFILALLIFTS